MSPPDNREALLTLGHELRRPLTVIRGAASLLAESGDRLTPDRRLHMLAMIEGAAQSMSRLVEDILLVCHLDGGDARVDLEPLPAGRLVQAALAEAGLAAGDGRVLVLNPSPEPILRADPHAASTVLRALLENAVRISPDRSPVELAVVSQPTTARIEVRDRGPGLDPDQVDAAFQRYARLHNPGSAGLGLYLARELARLMEGEVGVEPRPAGGAVFWFRLALDG